MNNIGEEIAKIRLGKNTSFRALSEKTGIDTKNLNAIEKGRTDARISTINKILDALGCEIDIIEKPTE